MIKRTIWARSLISPDASILEALEVLNKSPLKLGLVVDSAGTLMGTITDGDIRRGLLKNVQISESILRVLNDEPIVADESVPQEELQELSKSNNSLLIPVVDANMKLKGLYGSRNEASVGNRPNTMVIMAGGKGTRLMPRTKNSPKPLLPVAGKPILEHIINRAKASGFSRFVLAIHHLGNQIEEYFGDGANFGVNISYTRETIPLGTAGALSLLDPRPAESFLVTNGDVLTDIDYGKVIDFHVENKATASMAVHLHEWKNPFGVARVQGIEITEFEEKPIVRSHVNAGIYVFDPVVLNFIQGSTFVDMPTFFEALLKGDMKVIAYPVHEKWLDLGSPSDFDRGPSLFLEDKQQRGSSL